MLDQLINYLIANFLPENTIVTHETKLISSGLIDSINTLKLVDFVEETFNVELEANEVSREFLDTPKMIINLVTKKLEK